MGRHTPLQKSYAERIYSVNSFQKSKKAVAIEADQIFEDSSESLLKGSYDEMESQMSFQKALAEWRGEKSEPESRLETPNPVQVHPGSTQTPFELISRSSGSLKELEKRVEKLLVNDNNSLSYMDKILLAKLKTSSEEEFRLDESSIVDSIMEEAPPSCFVGDCDDFKHEGSGEVVTSKLVEIITIQELDYDDYFNPDEILDSQKIIIEEPNEE